MSSASIPISPSSSPKEAMMKSEFAKGTRLGYPLPHPVPSSPPEAMPNSPVTSCWELPYSAP